MKIEVGDNVLVSDPKHQHSEHLHEFVGVVVDVYSNNVLVQDQDYNLILVESDEILEVSN